VAVSCTFLVMAKRFWLYRKLFKYLINCIFFIYMLWNFFFFFFFFKTITAWAWRGCDVHGMASCIKESETHEYLAHDIGCPSERSTPVLSFFHIHISSL
jgi:hypothetical protein